MAGLWTRPDTSQCPTCNCLAGRRVQQQAENMDYSKIITTNPAIRSGKPSIRDTRVTVSDILEYLAGGMSEDEILHDFPYLTREDIRACLAFAAEREKRILTAVS